MTSREGLPSREQAERRPDGSVTVEAVDSGSTVLLCVAGEIDIATAEEVRSAIGAAEQRLDGRRLAIDLSGVRFLGSAGLAVLADTAERLSEDGGPRLPVVVRDGPVSRVLALSGLDRMLHVVDGAATGLPE